MAVSPPERQASVRDRIVAAIRWIRRPELGVIGQGVRYALAGATVAAVSLAATLLLAEVVGLAFEVAFAIGYSLAIITHFTLQRVFVWSHHEEFALPMHLQLVRYLPVALSNYGFVALAVAVLPGPLGLPTVAVYVGATVAVTAFGFVVLRTRVFHAVDSPGEPR